MKEIPSSEEREDSAHFIRHSKSAYRTYEEIQKSESPEQQLDPEKQVTPDLPEAGIELAEQEADKFFEDLDPETDAIFFTSSNEARALETANIYRKAAHEKGFDIITPENTRGELAEEIGEGEIRVLKNLSLNIDNVLLSGV